MYLYTMYIHMYYLHVHTFAVLNFDLFCGWQTSFDCQRLCLCFSLSLFRFVHFSSLQNRSTLPQQAPTPQLSPYSFPPSHSCFKFPVFKFTNRSPCRQHDCTPLNTTRPDSTRLDSLANPTNC